MDPSPSIGDSASVAAKFHEYLAEAKKRIAEAGPLGPNLDPISMCNDMRELTDDLLALASRLNATVDLLLAEWVQDMDRLAEASHANAEFALEERTVGCWSKIRTGFDAYLRKCAESAVRPLGFSAWAQLAWAGERQRGDRTRDLVLSFAMDVDHRRHAPRQSAPPVGDTLLLRELRELHARHPHLVAKSPQRGVKVTTGSWLPKGIFREVLAWRCSSQGFDCTAPWTPEHLDRWIDANYEVSQSPMKARYGTALDCLSERVKEKLAAESPAFAPSNQQAIEEGDATAIKLVVHELSTRWNLIPTPSQAPADFAFVCPNFRRCGGVLKPQFADHDA